MHQAIGTDPGLEGVRPYTTNLAHGYHSDNSDLVGEAANHISNCLTQFHTNNAGNSSACAHVESAHSSPPPIYTLRPAVPA